LIELGSVGRERRKKGKKRQRGSKFQRRKRGTK
jgi:hypothetical protein